MLTGALCININITNMIALENFLRRYSDFSNDNGGNQEVFATDVKSVLEYLIGKAQAHVGKGVGEMGKVDRIKFLGYLDKKGAFLINKSSGRTLECLIIYKSKLYSYPESICSTGEGEG